jgi:hypothetical protein
VNLAILALLEREQIDPLAYTPFGNIEAYAGLREGGGPEASVPAPLPE